MSIELPFFNDLPVAVLGLGRSGTVAARALMDSGADVWAWDDNEDVRAKARDAGIPIVDLLTCNWRELTTLVISPGIPLTHPEPHPAAVLARQHDVEIIGDIELLARSQRDAQYVGVTGTNGKSTTTALIGHILETAGREVQVGGNLGTPALSLEPQGPGGIYVLEMSSYQLEITLSITFDVAVLLNISPDHIERHGGFDGYVTAKRQIFHRQTAPRSAVIGVDDSTCQGIWSELAAAAEQIVVPISGKDRVAGGIYVVGGVLYDETGDTAVAAIDLQEVPTLPGSHNWQNAAAAYAACKAIGVAPPVITACLRSFPGLAHRQEVIAVIDRIVYVNDSKATNADAAAKALASYENIYWIAGGRAKAGGLSAVEPVCGRIVHAFLIGEAAEAFAKALSGKVECTLCGDLETAVARARDLATAKARPRSVVLLSPACASFDQYSDFAARGDAFRVLVEALPGERSDPEAAFAGNGGSA